MTSSNSTERQGTPSKATQHGVGGGWQDGWRPTSSPPPCSQMGEEPSGHSQQAVTPLTSKDCHSVPGPGHKPMNKVASAPASMERWCRKVGGSRCSGSHQPEGSLVAAGRVTWRGVVCWECAIWGLTWRPGKTSLGRRCSCQGLKDEGE